ncbi:phospholipid-transporting ATPase ABCA1-like isoform X1 [Lampetra planeri]
MAFWTQLRLLLWKNFTLRKRQKVRLLLELTWPLFLFVILVLVRNTQPPYRQHQCYFPNKPLPSAGALPWLQGVLCNANNPCFSQPTPGETPGQLNNFGGSIVSRLIGDIQHLLSNETQMERFDEALEDVRGLSHLAETLRYRPDVVAGRGVRVRDFLREHENLTLFMQRDMGLPRQVSTEILEMRVRLEQFVEGIPSLSLKEIACDDQLLRHFLVFRSARARSTVRSALCFLPQPRLQQLEDVLYANVDFYRLLREMSFVLDDVSPRLSADGWREVTTSLADLFRQFTSLQSFTSLMREASFLNGLGLAENTSDGLREEQVGPVLSSLSGLLCGHPEAGGRKILSFNWYEDNDYKTFLGIDDNDDGGGGNDEERQGGRRQHQYDNSTTPFCNALLQGLQTNSASRFAWTMLQPLLQGKILYAPDTPATRSIMHEANRTFAELEMIYKFGLAWEEVAPQIWDFLNSSLALRLLRETLGNAAVATFVDSQLSDTGLDAKTIADFLSEGPSRERGNGTAPGWREVFMVVDLAIRSLTRFLECMELDKLEGVQDEPGLERRALELLEERKLWAGVVFLDLFSPSALPQHLRYKIRTDIDRTERTSKSRDRYWDPGPRADAAEDMSYIWGGFAYLQDMVERGIVQAQTGAATMGLYLQQMPYPCFVDDPFTTYIGNILPMFMTLAFILPVCLIIKSIVWEKERRLKEVLRASGLGRGTLWAAWFTDSVLTMVVSCAFLAVIIKYGKVLQYSDPLVLFLFLTAFAVATVSQCFLLSVFFSRANLAAACGGLAYFLLYLPHILCFMWQDYLTFPIKMGVSLLSTVAFGFGCESISRLEEQGIGIQWHNLASNPAAGESYTLLTSLLMMLCDAVLYGLLTWYIEAVFPGQYGVPKPWHFPFTSCVTTLGPQSPQGTTSSKPMAEDVLVEEESVELTLGVSVQNLVKKYSTMERPAVDGLSLNFYQDQITSFLGHNGAGKTTTMSILTGLFPPTAGTALIYGKDIRTEMESIRSSLGTCPQHNVLFNQLTVEEHIWFYARLKGCSSEDVKEEVERMLEDTGLLMKRAEQAGNLSGGMQRKLSVAMAFVAGSRLVILDEPTAGVDPFARRGIWELLLKYKHGRTIILSTHHMDEAETLGDRIAVIARGRLRCCGSSLFLKSCYGTGYYLTVVRSGADLVGPSGKGQQQPAERPGKSGGGGGGGGGNLDTNEDETDGSSSHNSSSDEGFSSERSLEEKLPGEVLILQSLVERLVPGARVVENVGQEVTFVLPYIGARDGSFALLFSHLDSKLEGLGISSYGVSDTTMEEIFLKVAEDPSLETEHKDEGVSTKGRGRWWKEKSSLSPSKTKENMDTELERRLEEKKAKRQKKLNPGGGGSDHKITGGALAWQQFRALIIKRFHHTRRSRKGFLSQIILPAVFVCLALVFTMIVPPFADYPVLELQPWMYPEQFTFYSDDAPNDLTTQKLVAAILDPPGLGTRCMMGYSIPNLPCQPRMPVWETPQASQAALDALNEGNWTFEDPSPSCQCSTPERLTMLPDCPPGAGGLPPPQMLQSTTDTLQNLTGRNISDYLVKTYAGFIEKRYGGFSLGQKNEQSDVNATALRRLFQQAGGFLNITAGPATEEASRNLEGFIQALGPTDNIKVWFNNKGWHAIVAFINVASNAVLRARLPEGQDPRRFGITAYSHPLNLTKQQLTEVAMLTSSVDVMVAICVIFSMSLIPASFVVFLVQERASNAKHLQFVSGVNAYVYWLANITWDMCNYILPAIIVVVIFLSFQQKAYVSDRNLPALILLLLLYGWSITPLMYPASFVFTVPSTAYVVLTCVNMFIGINGSMATYILELFNGDETLTRINDILKSVLLIFPHFCLGRGLIDMATNQALADASERFGESRFREPLSWDMVGKNLVAMFIEGSVFIVLTLLIQKDFFIRPRSMELNLPPITDEDVDVAAERKRVMEGDTSTDILTINELTKVYKKKGAPAVDRMCVGVRPGECFGLLGVNGAGKTSAFRMLTGDTHATAGDARLEGYSILSQLSSVQSRLGYCPQFDGTDELLTGREHLQLYARLRGVREDDLERVVDWAVSTLGLIYIADRSAGSYSGGNKRKLSTAIALIGNPPLVFLDEPTTGMDPKARRFLWNCILAIVQAGRSVVLTSHSMEECESLCTRMAIMVSGTFRCLGSVQHIKTRFGEGHTLVIRLAAATPPAAAATADPAAADTADATAADPAAAVAEYVCKRFPRTELREHHHRTMYFHLPGATTTHGASAGDTAAASACASLSTIFAALAENQQQLGIADFSVSQTTLDQVFVSFARQQRTDPVDEETGV